VRVMSLSICLLEHFKRMYSPKNRFSGLKYFCKKFKNIGENDSNVII